MCERELYYMNLVRDPKSSYNTKEPRGIVTSSCCSIHCTVLYFIVFWKGNVLAGDMGQLPDLFIYVVSDIIFLAITKSCGVINSLRLYSLTYSPSHCMMSL